MNTIELLEFQHRQVDELFSQIERVKDPDSREELFTMLAYCLAIHATIEEHHFYPAVLDSGAECVLVESIKEPLGLDDGDEAFAAVMVALEEEVRRHDKAGEEKQAPDEPDRAPWASWSHVASRRRTRAWGGESSGN